MRWVRYEADGAVRYGILEGEDIAEVSGTPFDAYERTAKRRKLAAVKLLVPVVPPTFYAAGINYMDHIIEQAKLTGREPKVPKKADIGYRANNALIAHGEPIVIPKDATEKVHYEGELVVVIGRKAKHLAEKEALSCVLGYTIGNDVSERSWQAEDRTLWRAKNTDTFKPMGPWIETDVRLDDLVTTVRVNGEQKIRFPTNKMLFGVAHYIAAMSRYLTLHPGDMIWMGTDGASPNLKHGDVVEVEISGIGVLRNPVVREA
ncbi:MAG: fumarylacetoacetate hydrolase family protein [Proteobacteria bacterium]|nr:fumarylacetoacetate hydrolase family protein [Pseudomonadota bacterium]